MNEDDPFGFKPDEAPSAPAAPEPPAEEPPLVEASAEPEPSPAARVPRRPAASGTQTSPKTVGILVGGAVLGVIVVAGALWLGRNTREAVAPVRAKRAPDSPIDCPAELTTHSSHAPGLDTWDCVGPHTINRSVFQGQRLVEQLHLTDGVLEGRVLRMPSPELRIEGTYAAGKEEGVWKTFRNDVLESDLTYVAGTRQGDAHLYGKDGGVLEVQAWDQGQPHGRFERYGVNGLPLVKGAFTRGAQSGLWTRYDERGQPIELTKEERDPLALDGPEQLTLDGGKVVNVEELFGGRPLSEWKIRAAELRASGTDAGLELLRHRAKVVGLTLDARGAISVSP